ncbi:class C sortase [Bifidobacterium aquikefiri]|uniref:class C sortase n=1 Tax=Bifidobacterium aquikefiri TaxID=1653207 RepID=UPI0039E80F9A
MIHRKLADSRDTRGHAPLNDPEARPHRRSFSLKTQIIIAFILYAICVSMIGWLVWKQITTNHQLSENARRVHESVQQWKPPRAEDAVRDARAYNQQLFAEGRTVLGEAVNPFDAQRERQAASIASKDSQYQDLLNMDSEGMLARLRVPSVSIDIPVYHGAAQSTLLRGAGHIYGTSLPVGGKNTHAVIAAHSGVVDASFFTRLHELKPGDLFIVQTMKEELAYQVTDIVKVLPDDSSHYGIAADEDRVTLMTCTPIGINTFRLLVSGERTAMPADSLEREDDGVSMIVISILGALIVAAIVARVWIRKRKGSP